MPSPLSGDDVCVLLVTEARELTDLVSEALQAWTVPYRLFWVSQLDLAPVRARDITPRIVLVDGQAGADQVLALVAQLSERVPAASILLLVDQERMDVASRAMFAGASGFVSLPLEPAELTGSLRRVLSRPGAGGSFASVAAARGRVIALCAPKGGTGRTTLAINSAISIRQRSQEPVVLVDGDFAAPAIDVALNLYNQPTIVDLLPRMGQLDRDLLDGVLAEHPSGIRLLLAAPPANLEAPISVPHMQQILAALKRSYAWILVDVGLPFDDMAYTVLDASDAIIVSVVPELVGVRNAQDMLGQFRRRGYGGDRVWVIVNQANLPGGLRVADVEARLGVRVRHQLPRDQALATTTVNQGVPFVLMRPYSPFAKGCRELAQMLIAAIGQPAAAALPYTVGGANVAAGAATLPASGPDMLPEALPHAAVKPEQGRPETAMPPALEVPTSADQEGWAAFASAGAAGEHAPGEAEPSEMARAESAAPPVIDAAVDDTTGLTPSIVQALPVAAEPSGAATDAGSAGSVPERAPEPTSMPSAERAGGMPETWTPADESAADAVILAAESAPVEGQTLVAPGGELARGAEGEASPAMEAACAPVVAPAPDLPAGAARAAAASAALESAATDATENALVPALAPGSTGEPPVDTATPRAVGPAADEAPEQPGVSAPAAASEIDILRVHEESAEATFEQAATPSSDRDDEQDQTGHTGAQLAPDQGVATGTWGPAVPGAPVRPHNPYARAGWMLAKALIKLAVRPAEARPPQAASRTRPAAVGAHLPPSGRDAPIPPMSAAAVPREPKLAEDLSGETTSLPPIRPSSAAVMPAHTAEIAGKEPPLLEAEVGGEYAMAPAARPGVAPIAEPAPQPDAESAFATAAPRSLDLAPLPSEAAPADAVPDAPALAGPVVIEASPIEAPAAEAPAIEPVVHFEGEPAPERAPEPATEAASEAPALAGLAVEAALDPAPLPLDLAVTETEALPSPFPEPEVESKAEPVVASAGGAMPEPAMEVTPLLPPISEPAAETACDVAPLIAEVAPAEGELVEESAAGSVAQALPAPAEEAALDQAVASAPEAPVIGELPAEIDHMEASDAGLLPQFSSEPAAEAALEWAPMTATIVALPSEATYEDTLLPGEAGSSESGRLATPTVAAVTEPGIEPAEVLALEPPAISEPVAEIGLIASSTIVASPADGGIVHASAVAPIASAAEPAVEALAQEVPEPVEGTVAQAVNLPPVAPALSEAESALAWGNTPVSTEPARAVAEFLNAGPAETAGQVHWPPAADAVGEATAEPMPAAAGPWPPVPPTPSESPIAIAAAHRAANAPARTAQRASSALTDLWAAARAMAAALWPIVLAVLWRLAGAGKAVIAAGRKSVTGLLADAGTSAAAGGATRGRRRLSLGIVTVLLVALALALTSARPLLEQRVPPAAPAVVATGGSSATPAGQRLSPTPQRALAYAPTSLATEPSAVPTPTPSLAASPTATARASSVPIQALSATATHTPAPPTPTRAIDARPPTSTVAATNVRRPTATAQMRPATARPATARPAAAQAPAAPTRAQWVSPPALVAPAENNQVRGVVLFTWLATGPLPAGTAYEVVWWNLGEDPSVARGIAPPTRDTSLQTNLDVLYQAHQLTNNQFHWTVLIVQNAPYARLIQPNAAGVHTLLYSP